MFEVIDIIKNIAAINPTTMSIAAIGFAVAGVSFYLLMQHYIAPILMKHGYKFPKAKGSRSKIWLKNMLIRFKKHLRRKK